jgi:hypothetical protein
VIDVLKHTSPIATPSTPTPFPQKTVPSVNTSAALAFLGRAFGGMGATGAFVCDMASVSFIKELYSINAYRQIGALIKKSTTVVKGESQIK